MRDTSVYDRVTLFKQKYEEHLHEEFFILPMHYKEMKNLKGVPLDEIAKRLDYMMVEDEWFAGDVQRCTVNSFIRNFSRFISSKAISKDKEIQKFLRLSNER